MLMQLPKEVFAQELYFENENVFQYDKVYAININDDQLNETDIENYKIEILKEIKIENEKQIDLNGNEKIFSFNQNTYNNNNNNNNNNSNNNNNIDIILLKNGSIECLYEIHNYIQDDEIIIKQKDCQILLNQQDCIKLYKLDQFIYIIQCNYNSTNTIIQILNQSQIFDQIIIPIQSNCQSDSIFNNNQTLIIFNKLCQTTLFYSISISNLLFLNLTKYDLLDDFSCYDVPHSILISILFCSSEQISINFHNIFVMYLLSEKKMYIQHRFENNAKIFQRLSNCESIENYIEENITSKQLLIRKKQLNMSSQFYIQSYLIQSLLILHNKEELLSLTKGWKYVKKIKINSAQVLPSASLDLKRFEIFTEQNLKFLLQSSKITHLIYKLNDTICINHRELQKSNPFEILIVQQKSKSIINQQNSILNLCQTQLISQQKMFVIQEQDVENHIILKIEDDILSIQACEQNQLKHSNKIKIKTDYINIFSFPNVLQIVIIYNYRIILIQFKNQQIIQKIQNLDLQILNCVQNFDVIYIIFEDCRKAIMKMNSEKIQVLFQQTYPFDCKLSLQFIFNEVFITQNEIMISSKKNFKRKLLNLEGNKNIMTIVLYHYLIIVRQVQNDYQLKLFWMIEEQAIFLYNLPTYDFKITLSLEYQTYESYLMLKAFKQNINYLLIYDITKTAILSLIRITKIDKDETLFFILSPNQILYYFQGQFIIQNISSTCFNYFNNFVNYRMFI
ncbi:unnamed protein product [Paramecium pentaurelia]|uniref:Uncharacterized protein n=1 Tax=Paramecium pentaurelia TaxID=43138 RepID=A0A8S1YFH8_9CILI|nr:unnamed protein product [Paramecium pentaurelia]